MLQKSQTLVPVDRPSSPLIKDVIELANRYPLLLLDMKCQSHTAIHFLSPLRNNSLNRKSIQQYDCQQSLYSSDDNFVSNLFGVDLGTPESNIHYINNLYAFGVQSFSTQACPSSSMHVVLNENVQQNESRVLVEEGNPTPHHSRHIHRTSRCRTRHYIGD